MAMYRIFFYYLTFFAVWSTSVRSDYGESLLYDDWQDYYGLADDNGSSDAKLDYTNSDNDAQQPEQDVSIQGLLDGCKDEEFENRSSSTTQEPSHEVLDTSESPVQTELPQVKPFKEQLSQPQEISTSENEDNSYWAAATTQTDDHSEMPMLVDEKQIQHVTNNINIDKVILTPIVIPPLAWLQLYSTTPQEERSEVRDEFDNFQKKWRALLVPEEFDNTNPALVNYVKKLSEDAEFLYETLNTNTDRTFLWSIEPEDTFSADLTTQFRKLQKLSLAYATNGATYYKDPKILSAVKDGLDFLVKPGKYDGEKYRGNWWDWQVGMPSYFIDILMIIKDELAVERRQQYTKAINSYVPDPYHLWWSEESFIDLNSAHSYEGAGAQRSALARTVLGVGILQKNITKISLSLDSITELFKPVTDGDGFYRDGSFIQHKSIPYTGLFGNALVYGLGEILAITKGSNYEIATDLIESLLETVERAFLPLIYRGEMIATVNGLSASRPSPATKEGYGSETMYNLLLIAKSVTNKHTRKIKESVKYWMQENRQYYLSNARTYNDLSMTISLLNDPAILGHTLPLVGTKMYASMDRFIQRTSNYMLGISLYSKRISAFEAGNNENKHGWHTADGALFLYNDDKIQFGDAYWPTVDPYRLPGTTVDTRHLNDEVAAYCTFPSEETWVGGVANSNQGVVGMSLNKAGFRSNWQTLSMDLKAKKSWFIVDGLVVALGAAITGTTEASIETIIENRMLNDQFSYDVVSSQGDINGTVKNLEVDWLLLKSHHQCLSIGYYFPNGENVTVISETRSGTYKDINEKYPSYHHFTADYRKFIIDHGQSPVDGTYAYVLLPGIEMSELIKKYSNKYSDKKPVKILENSADIQAVEITDEGYLGVNIWRETGGEIEGISSNKPVSLMRQNKSNQHSYILSDPTQLNNVVILQIPDFSNLVTMDEGISYDVEYNQFVVNFTDASGASKKLIVENRPDSERNELDRVSYISK